MRLLQTFWRDERGATSIEYALIAAGIGIVIITGVNSVGNSLNTKFLGFKTKIG